MAQAQRAESANDDQQTSYSKSPRPLMFMRGKVEIAIWPNA
jgi:hypothetical protein